MKYPLTLALFLLVTTQALAIEPIPGSITYDGPPVTMLKKAPIGSQITHQFTTNGRTYLEMYLLDENRNLQLVSRFERMSD